MKKQIDANRRLQGPGAGLQITGGDVADAYFRAGRQAELVAIVRHAVDAGLVPMLMTHGQTLLEHPDFLERLVADGGLRQMAVHIDITQAGRSGFPINRLKNEADLHPVRAAFTALALRIRARTGTTFELAHNCTVTERNIDSIAEVVRWFRADAQRSKIWRILSFQPEANTGRTIFSRQPVNPQIAWREICRGLGVKTDGSAFIGGHHDCNQGGSFLVSERTNRLLPLIPGDAKTRALFGEILEKLGAISTVTTGDDGLVACRAGGALARHPRLAARIGWRLVALLFAGAVPAEFLHALATGRAHTLNIGTHNFMDAAQVANAPNDPVVQARLDACVFKGAVQNRANGTWEAVPMCAMNESRWRQLYAERLLQEAFTSAAPGPGG